MNIQAWDNAEGMSQDISREGLKGTIGVIQKIAGVYKEWINGVKVSDIWELQYCLGKPNNLIL